MILKKQLIVIIGGPTASGKSKLALDLALSFGGSVINADSMQIYREMKILTARPTETEEKRVKHRLYGIISVKDRCSAGRWCALALSAIADSQMDNQLPIVVGGTGLYLKALIDGLPPIPPISDEIRDKSVALYKDYGAEKFYQYLQKRDPEGMLKLTPSNTQRILRAYQVIESTGRSLSDWQSMQRQSTGFKGEIKTFILNPPRDLLYESCNMRAIKIASNGGIQEAKNLISLNLDPTLPAMKAIGVPEFAAYLNGESDSKQATDRLCVATRRYAKRQITWFRHQIPKAYRFNSLYKSHNQNIIFQKIKTFLNQPGATD